MTAMNTRDRDAQRASGDAVLEDCDGSTAWTSVLVDTSFRLREERESFTGKRIINQRLQGRDRSMMM